MNYDGGLWHCTWDNPQEKNQDHPQEKEMQKSKMAVWGGLTNSCEKREEKSKGEKERYTHFNAEPQRIIHKVNHWHLFKDFYKRVFQDEHIGCSLRPWEGLLSEAYLWGKCLWQRSLLNLGLRNN